MGDERLRIARELHDVLAHHIAVINVQAGVAGHLLERQPEQAREALDHVRAAARSMLSEMQAVVTVLREPGEALEPADPTPSMDQLGALIEGYRAVGLTIDTVVRGAPTALPATVDLVAYRAVQESLTNVRKHAGNASVVVELDYLPTSFSLTVTNSGTGPRSQRAGVDADSTAGFGLMGMRERVGSVGGAVRAGPTPDGGFVVAASLPVDQEMLSR